jgi:Helicase associated domain
LYLTRIRFHLAPPTSHHRRQRYQQKLKQSGLHSTLSDEREAALTDVGFIWDSHRATWFEKLHAMEAFRSSNGHCSVPSTYRDPSLMVWCKHQRRQYRLYRQGLKSTITEERVRCLESIGFGWNGKQSKGRSPSGVPTKTTG